MGNNDTDFRFIKVEIHSVLSTLLILKSIVCAIEEKKEGWVWYSQFENEIKEKIEYWEACICVDEYNKKNRTYDLSNRRD